MNKSYIISGSLFGDEGKGSFVDYLANEKGINQNVRYNGGSQACHTVTIRDTKHKFSQLGSTMFIHDNRTYLSSNTIVNPFNLYNEANIFSKSTNNKLSEILSRVYIDSNALVVTPYHSLIDRIIELSKSGNRRGIVGSGVSLTKRLFDTKALGIRVNDIEKMDSSSREKIKDLYRYTIEVLNSKIGLIDKKQFDTLIDPKELFYLTDKTNEDYIIHCYENIMNANRFNIVNGIEEFYTPNRDLIMEGSQGLLIDGKYGIKPNTTYLDTTNSFGVKLSNDIGYKPVKIGASRCVASRHGIGILPTKDNELNNRINDENQTKTFWQGSPIYGWYDAVLMRYSERINKNDELFISSLDLLSGLDILKICNSYLYTGIVDEEFRIIFDFERVNNKIIINEIKENSEALRNYLGKCIPLYIEMKGFGGDISEVKDINNLSEEAINYINRIEELVGVQITLIGVGPSREQKIRRLVK